MHIMAEATLIAVVAFPLQEMPADGPATKGCERPKSNLHEYHLKAQVQDSSVHSAGPHPPKSYVLCADNRYVMVCELSCFLNMVRY